MSTLTLKERTLSGNTHKDYYSLDLSGGATSHCIKTGGKNVLMCKYTNQVTEGQGLVHPNYSDAGTTESAGDVFLSAFTANDNLDIEVTYI